MILCGFALVVGSLTVHRIRSDFNTEVAASADNLASLLQISVGRNDHLIVNPNIDEYAAPEHAVIRVILSTSASVIENTPHAPELDPPNGRIAGLTRGENVDGYRVESRAKLLSTGGYVVIQYARPLSDVQPTIARVELLLLLGTLAGTGLALLAGATIARRAMQPIATLTSHRRGDRAHPGLKRRDPPARGRRRGRRAGPHAAGDAAFARRRPRRDRGDARPPAPLRRRRLARAAHAAHLSACQP